VGGGATGLGSALDAVTRGYKTLLLEAQDYAKATSSRSTKLVHGGVRYLQKGDIKLVLEALRERGRMLRNAPHLAHKRAFVVPAYAWWEFPFYGVGLTLYDVLAGKEGLGRSSILSRKSTLEALPTVRDKDLKGGILYYDGQFDDARYAIALMRTFVDNGGVALNYARVTGLLKDGGSHKICGVAAKDEESGETFECRVKVVINATGIFSDGLRQLDDATAKKILAVSQGTHFVLPGDFLPGRTALMVPRTSDGRVLFAIPWHDKVVVGTTDDPVAKPEYEPRAMADEKQFLLEHIERFLGRKPKGEEIASVWSGQRPLVRNEDVAETASISREHTILVSESKLVTITGGKWTTYRKMAQDVVTRAAEVAGFAPAPAKTAELHLHGWVPQTGDDWLAVYGSDAPAIVKLASENSEWSLPIHDRLPFSRAEVIWAARFEMARTVEDVLARRTRGLFLDARACMEAAPVVAGLLAHELAQNPQWEVRQVAEFREVAAAYIWDV
jgi:glycerol-3-phosphate dehydrogenase